MSTTKQDFTMNFKIKHVWKKGMRVSMMGGAKGVVVDVHDLRGALLQITVKRDSDDKLLRSFHWNFVYEEC